MKEGAASSAGVVGRVPFVPSSTASALLVPLEDKEGDDADGSGSFLALLSPERRAFSTSEVAWAQSCALKLQGALG